MPSALAVSTSILRSLSFAFLGLTVAGGADAQQTLIRQARVFDGARVIGVRDVLVSDGKIAAIETRISPPAGAVIVNGEGRTLLPGLIDSHTHVFGDALEQALMFGVTTEMDMFTDVGEASRLRAQQKAGNVATRADIYSAGTLVTSPKGHGTEYGMAIPTISSPDSAQAFVDARIREGSDYIKIVYDGGRAYGSSNPTISRETLIAVIQATHKRGKMAVVHIGDFTAAREAIEGGADGLVHLFTDMEPAADFGKLAASKKAFVIPTLSVLYSVSGKTPGAEIAKDPRLAPYMSASTRGTVSGSFPVRRGSPVRNPAFGEAAIRQFLAASVPILAGTDAPNPGTAHGIAMHRELELLVNAGLTPVQALAAATSVPAKVFSLGDRGRIVVGKRADLLLVEGDPTIDITKTRNIDGVWKGGVRLDRAAFAAELAAAAKRGGDVYGGPVSGFDDGTTKAAFGSGWVVSTDRMAGGSSSAAMNVVEGGAKGTPKALSVTGTVVGPLAYAWGGVMFMAGAQPMQPANLTKGKAIHFWAKGDGKTYKIMLFAQSKGMMPMTQDFVTGADWKEYVFPYSSFGAIDGSDIMAFGFTGGPAPGTFALQIDEVELR